MRGVLVKPVAGGGGGVTSEIYLSAKSYFRSKDLIVVKQIVNFLFEVIFLNENIIFSKQLIDFLVTSHVFERIIIFSKQILGVLGTNNIFEANKQVSLNIYNLYIYIYIYMYIIFF